MELILSSNLDPEYAERKVLEYNLRHFPKELHGRYQKINLLLADSSERIYGGLSGEICWNWLAVEYLFVEEEARGSGWGKRLMEEAERIAVQHGCDFIKVDTLSFQALDFYIKLGYEVYGMLPNAATFEHYFLKKDL